MAKAKQEVKKTTFIVDGKECVVANPDFKQTCLGLSSLTDASVGAMALAGRDIYELCMISCDKAIKEDTKLFMSVCIDIAKEYLLPVEVEIKKN